MLIEFILIFLAKLIEVVLTSTRIMLTNKNKRKWLIIIAFLEISMWLFVISKVVISLTDYPYRAFAYALGFSLGHYAGSLFNEKLSLGTITMQVILNTKEGIELTKTLRDKGIAVTSLDGEGMEETKKILILYLPKKRKNEVIEYIHNETDNVLIITSPIDDFNGGYRIDK